MADENCSYLKNGIPISSFSMDDGEYTENSYVDKSLESTQKLSRKLIKIERTFKPICPGIYMCSIEHMQSSESSEDILSDLQIQALVILCCNYENPDEISILTDNMKFKLDKVAMNKYYVKIPLGEIICSSFIHSNPLTEFEQTLSNLSQKYHRLLILFLDHEHEWAVPFTAFCISKLFQMSIDASLQHLNYCFNYSKFIINGSLKLINALTNYISHTHPDVIRELNFRYDSFIYFARKHKIEQYDCYPNRYKSLLRPLLIQYANRVEIRDKNSKMKFSSIYKCQKCAQDLFTEMNILYLPNSQFPNHIFPGSSCKTLFIEPVSWMFNQQQPDQDCLYDRTICCPNCRNIIGHFRFKGMKCLTISKNGICRQHQDMAGRIFQINSSFVYKRKPKYLTSVLHKILHGKFKDTPFIINLDLKINLIDNIKESSFPNHQELYINNENDHDQQQEFNNNSDIVHDELWNMDHNYGKVSRSPLSVQNQIDVLDDDNQQYQQNMNLNIINDKDFKNSSLDEVTLTLVNIIDYITRQQQQPLHELPSEPSKSCLSSSKISTNGFH